jgi:outer membrane phospholipase A
MEFSSETLALLQRLESSAQGHSLRKRNDVGQLIESAFAHDKSDEFNALVLHGMSAWKVFHILKKMQPADEAYSHVEAEFAREINALRDCVYQISLLTDTATQTRWLETYMTTTSGALRNLIDLSADLAKIKDLQNASRYQA